MNSIEISVGDYNKFVDEKYQVRLPDNEQIVVRSDGTITYKSETEQMFFVEQKNKFNKIRKKKFLLELSKLSNQLDISVEGCGCCGSPLLWDYRTNSVLGECLFYNEEISKYQGEDL